MDKTGKVYKYGNLRFWAQDGFIAIVNEITGELRFVSRKEFLQRAKVVNEAAKKNPFKDERLKMIRFAENAIAACQEAYEQGNPLNPKHRKQHATDHKKLIYVIENGIERSININTAVNNENNNN